MQKNLKEMYEAQLEFPEGLGLRKIPSVGEVWIFFGITQQNFLQGQPKAGIGHKNNAVCSFRFFQSIVSRAPLSAVTKSLS